MAGSPAPGTRAAQPTNATVERRPVSVAETPPPAFERGAVAGGVTPLIVTIPVVARASTILGFRHDG